MQNKNVKQMQKDVLHYEQDYEQDRVVTINTKSEVYDV